MFVRVGDLIAYDGRLLRNEYGVIRGSGLGRASPWATITDAKESYWRDHDNRLLQKMVQDLPSEIPQGAECFSCAEGGSIQRKET